MINIDFLTLKAFILENIDFIIGARLQKVQQPTRKDFIFFLRNNSESRKLYININPAVYHLAFMNEENEKKRGLEIPQHPPMFCMLLRKYLEGARISDACVIDNERILEFHFDTCDEYAQTRSLCLAIELMGKHSNVILYDRKTLLIIGCAHNVGTEKSRYRELKGGLRYIYPPKKSGISLSDELKKQFNDLSQNEINKYLSSEEFRPAWSSGRYTLFSELLPNAQLYNSVNSLLDDYYSEFQRVQNLKILKNRLSEVANSRLNKNKNSISKITSLLSKRDNGDTYKLYGELLTSNLYLKADYQDKIKLFDHVNNRDITIELDNTKTMNENAQRYFKLYSKFKNTKEKSRSVLENLNMEKAYLENVLYSIDCAENKAELEEISAEIGIGETKIKSKEKPSIQKFNIRGFGVYVGKNNKQNDYIISKLAKDEDYWFHTKMCAGSHVLLKVDNKEPDEALIYECAKLARSNSSAKQPSKVSVIYTKRKYLRKPPSSPPGYVTYKNETEILI